MPRKARAGRFARAARKERLRVCKEKETKIRSMASKLGWIKRNIEDARSYGHCMNAVGKIKTGECGYCWWCRLGKILKRFD